MNPKSGLQVGGAKEVWGHLAYCSATRVRSLLTEEERYEAGSSVLHLCREYPVEQFNDIADRLVDAVYIVASRGKTGLRDCLRAFAERR
jgi:hypothetical protein